MIRQPANAVNATIRFVLSPDALASATTRELIAVYDIAKTLADVLIGLSQAPRCAGLADTWIEPLLNHLYQTKGLTGAALLGRDDESGMRMPILADFLEPDFYEEDGAAVTLLLRGIAVMRDGGVGDLCRMEC